MFVMSAGATLDRVSYDGYSVLELLPRTGDEIRWIQGLKCRSLADWLGVDTPAHLLCNRKQARNLKSAARRKGIHTKYISKHLGREIKEEARTVDVFNNLKRERKQKINKNKNKKKKKNVHAIKNNFRHRSYLGAQLMYDFLEKLDDKYENMKIENMGKTGEGRDVKIVKINSNKTDLPIIFIDAGIHAREWISPASTLFLIEKLTKRLSKGQGKADIALYQWHIIPLANPDGYEYTRTKDRMWRKNTAKIPGSSCIGVDLNRNFPEGYGIGASRNPCSEVYQGPHPLSELEAVIISNYISTTRGIKAAVSVHSYGNVLIYPWGYKQEQHPHKTQLSSIATDISQAIEQKYSEKYEPGTAREVFGLWGLAGGATDDWYITQGVDYSYTFELPGRDADGEHHGFLLPAKNIIKVGKQLLLGFTTMAAKLK